MITMEWVKNVNNDAEVAYVLTLTEKVVDILARYEWFHLVRESMDMCWEWVEEKKHSGDELYERLDDEFNGLYFIDGVSSVDDDVEDPQVELVWYCVVDAVGYTARQAYQYEKRKYVPQPIEVVSDEYMDDEFMEKIRQVEGYQERWSERLKQYLLEHYSPASSDKRINRSEILSQI